VIALLLLAVALAMDAFAVSLCQGATIRNTGQALKLALAFGIAQALMPLIGWALGVAFSSWFAAVDHWIAFILLAGIGAKMIHEGRSEKGEEAKPALAGTALIAAAIATSIDAAAAGVTLPTLGVDVMLACAIIGVVTFALCLIGATGGARLGSHLGNRAEIFGGVVLIGLGAKILAEHSGWL